MPRITLLTSLVLLAACGPDGLRDLTCERDGACPADPGEPTPKPPPAPPMIVEPTEPVLRPIDPLCDTEEADTSFPPKPEALPKTVPAGCRSGFELNQFEKATYDLDAKSSRGAGAVTLEVDIATYKAPDTLQIRALSHGVEHTLLSMCRLQTADYGDPTKGTERPPEDSIREFRIPLPGGTTRLTFDHTLAKTPTYVRVLGLCDFTVTAPAGMGAKWRAVSDE